MAITPSYFQPPSFSDSNPWLLGAQAGQQIASGNLEQALQAQQIQKQQILNRYLGPQQQQGLLATQLANLKSQQQLPYAGPMAAAQLATQQQQPNLVAGQAANQFAQASVAPSDIALHYAMAGNDAANAALTRGITPGKTARANLDIYSQPTPAMLYQLQNFQKSLQGNNDPVSSMLSPQGYGALTPNPSDIAGVQNGSPIGVPFATGSQQAQSVANMPQLPGNLPPARLGSQINTGESPLPSNVPSGVKTVPAPSMNSIVSNQLKFGTNQDPTQVAQVETQNTQNIQNWGDYLNTINRQATAANAQMANLNQIQNAYKNSGFTGTFLGQIPPSLADSARQELAKGLAALQQGNIAGHGAGILTDIERINMNQTLPQAEFHPQAFNEIADFMKGKANQMRDVQAIAQAAHQGNNGIPVDPNATKAVAQKYIDQRPVYDFGSQSPINYADNYQAFLKDPNIWNSVATGIPYVKVPDFGSQPGTAQYKQDYQKWFSNLDATDQQYLQQNNSQPKTNTPGIVANQLPQGTIEKRATTKEGRSAVKIGRQWFYNDTNN